MKKNWAQSEKKNTATNKSTRKFGFKWSQVMELPQKEYPKVIQVNLGNGNLTFCWLNFSVMTQKLRIIYNLVRKKWRVKKKINISVHQSKEIKRKEWNFRRQRKKKSFEPDSNQRPKDNNLHSTVLRSTNWAIEGATKIHGEK